MAEHRPNVAWVVDVMPDDVKNPDDPVEIARSAYWQICSHQMRPVLSVVMPDGSVHDVDLEECEF